MHDTGGGGGSATHGAAGTLFSLLCAVTASIGAGDLTQLRVTDQQGVYHVEVTVTVDAPAEYVRGVLTDYAHIRRLNPAITESEVLQSPDRETVRVRTVARGCVAFFCRDMVRVEDVRELPSGDLQAVIVPGLGSFRSGAAHWNIEPQGRRTRITYQGFMEPGFFIPPLIGSYFVKRGIREELDTGFSNIECFARLEAHMDGYFDQPPSALQTASMCAVR